MEASSRTRGREYRIYTRYSMKAGLWIIAFVRKAGEFDISFVWNERERKREERYFSSFREFKNRKILVIRIDNSFEIFL